MMRPPALLLLTAGLVTAAWFAMSCGKPVDLHPVVIMDTGMGSVEITLDRETAPKTVANFLAYLDEGFYDGVLIHRITPRLIQGGGYDRFRRAKPTRDPVPNEADNGLSHVRGTVAMARTSDVNSATSQFFINYRDNTSLDGLDYTIFGCVTDGMAVIDSIAATPVRYIDGEFSEFPLREVIINRIYRAAPEP